MQIIIILSLFLASCAQPLSQQDPDSDPQLMAFIEQFESLTGKNFDGKTYFTTTEELKEFGVGVLAVCTKYLGGKKEIYIDENFWEQSDDSFKEELIFHELGHCVLNRDHDDRLVGMNIENTVYIIPKTIMYPYVFGGIIYEKFHDYYTRELVDEDTSLTNEEQ